MNSLNAAALLASATPTGGGQSEAFYTALLHPCGVFEQSSAISGKLLITVFPMKVALCNLAKRPEKTTHRVNSHLLCH